MSVRDAILNSAPQGTTPADGSATGPSLDADAASYYADAQAYVSALQTMPPESGAPPHHTEAKLAASADAAPATNFFAQEQQFFDKSRAAELHRDATIGLQPLADATLGDGASAAKGHTAAAVFTKAGVPVPPKALLVKVHKAVAGTPEFNSLVSYFHKVVTPDNPKFASLNSKTEAKKVVAQAQSISKPINNAPVLKDGTKQATVNIIDVANGMAAVFLALNASMAEDNKNKEVILKQMDICNQISKVIQGYITTLQKAQSELDAKTAGKDPSKTANATVPVQAWTNVDIDALFASATTPGATTIIHSIDYQAKAGNATLSADLSAGQGLQQLANANSTTQSNRYQSHDQDATQSFSLMATIIKSVGDVWSAIGKNIS